MKKEKPYWSHCTYMGSLRILPPGRQLRSRTIISHTSVPQRWIQNGIHVILLFRINKMRSWQQVGCWGRDLKNSGDNLWQGCIKILASTSGIREGKFGKCFNCSHYCFQCWGTRLNMYTTNRIHWSCSKVGYWIGSSISHIGVYNSEGTSESAPSLFEPTFPNKWPEVAIQTAAAWCFWWHFACRNQVQAWQQVCRGICHKMWNVACVSHG